jgi:hypothetical protein
VKTVQTYLKAIKCYAGKVCRREEMTELQKNFETLEAENGVKEVVTLQEIVPFFECPVCLQFSENDLFLQCCNGHTGCQACYSRLSVCPVCRLVLQPTVKAISDEHLALMKQELRHVENPREAIKLMKLTNIFRCVAFFVTIVPLDSPLGSAKKAI